MGGGRREGKGGKGEKKRGGARRKPVERWGESREEELRDMRGEKKREGKRKEKGKVEDKR